MISQLLDKSPTKDVEIFCNKCKKLNYTNNQSLESIKYDKLDGKYGIWIGTFDNNELISLSGVHKLFNGARVFFRGATLPGYAPRKHLGKNILEQMFHIQYHLPLQLQWGKQQNIDKFYITTNIRNYSTMDEVFNYYSRMSDKRGISILKLPN